MISETFVREGDFKQAHALLSAALEHALSSESRDCVSYVALVQSSVHVMQGDLEGARCCIKVAIDKESSSDKTAICCLAAAHIELR